VSRVALCSCNLCKMCGSAGAGVTRNSNTPCRETTWPICSRGRRSLASEPYLILAALVAVYTVLGVLYENYIHPITILFTLPSAGIGALLAPLMFHVDLSIIALIGIILLIGIVKKNAIMMIDFALDAERKEGALPEGPSIRLACFASDPS
jgi:hypothetical protein